MTSVSTPAAPAAIGPYSQAVAAGEWVFCSGQIALDPATGALVEGDVARQAEQCLRNLAAVLQAAGLTLRHVVKATVYLTDMDAFAAVNQVYAAQFGDHRPARAVVEVSRLPKNASVEIECIAMR